VPTIIIMLILSMGGIMSVGYEKVYLMQSDMNVKVSEVISTYVYKVGLLNAQYSYSTAMGIFNSLINCALLVLSNTIAKRVSSYGLF
nr:sugar ABC transporter permease [Clostridia bacterium]